MRGVSSYDRLHPRVEHPVFTQAMFALDRVRVLAPQHPEWKSQEPFSVVLSGDLEKVANFTEKVAPLFWLAQEHRRAV